MTLRLVIPWVTTAFGASIMLLAGKKRTRQWAWRMGILNNVVWSWYAVVTGQWGFLGGSLLYGTVYIRNMLRDND